MDARGEDARVGPQTCGLPSIVARPQLRHRLESTQCV